MEDDKSAWPLLHE